MSVGRIPGGVSVQIAHAAAPDHSFIRLLVGLSQTAVVEIRAGETVYDVNSRGFLLDGVQRRHDRHFVSQDNSGRMTEHEIEFGVAENHLANDGHLIWKICESRIQHVQPL